MGYQGQLSIEKPPFTLLCFSLLKVTHESQFKETVTTRVTEKLWHQFQFTDTDVGNTAAANRIKNQFIFLNKFVFLSIIFIFLKYIEVVSLIALFNMSGIQSSLSSKSFLRIQWDRGGNEQTGHKALNACCHKEIPVKSSQRSKKKKK